MGRRWSGHPTCEMCLAIDVRHWKREGLLRPGNIFPYSWTRAGEPVGSISVRIEPNATVAVLSFLAREDETDDWKRFDQRVPIVLTWCHFGGHRPWFCCTARPSGLRCNRRVAKLYLGAAPLFACRACLGLTYASQTESPRFRNISRSRKIRVQLGGTADLFDPFPEKPRRMHWRTYMRIRARGEAADNLAKTQAERLAELWRRRVAADGLRGGGRVEEGDQQ